MFRLIDFVFLSLLVGFVLPVGVPWAIQNIHERLDPKGIAYEAALVQNQAKTTAARQRYVSMYLALGTKSPIAANSNESSDSNLADRDEVP